VGAFESDKSQNAENVHIPESRADMTTKFAERKQALLPKIPKKAAAALDQQSNVKITFGWSFCNCEIYAIVPGHWWIQSIAKRQIENRRQNV
jgi:hypothetical protein